MKKILYLFLVVLVVIPLTVHAANLVVANDGRDAVGEVEIQIIEEKFTLPYAKANDDITFNGDFDYIINKKYTVSESDPSLDELKNGTFDSERNTKLTYESLRQEAPYVVCTRNLTTGINTIPGSIVIMFKEAGIDKDGNKYDVKMTIDNIKIESTFNTTKPVSLLHGIDKLWMNTYPALQEVSGDKVAVNNGVPSIPMDKRIGTTYDVSFTTYKVGTTETTDKHIGLAFTDLDAGDLVNRTSVTESYVDSEGVSFPYVEGITLISGVADKVHLTPNSFLSVSNTEHGENTRFAGTRIDNNSDDSGFFTLVNANSFEYNWTGSHCGTLIGLMKVFKITTSTSGDYPDNVRITPTQKDILWKSSKTITMTPDHGYSVSKIIIDDVVIDYASLELSNGKRTYTKDGVTYTFTEANGVVSYTFSSNVKDHTIDVAVDKTGYVIHYDPNGGKGTMEDTVGEFDVKGTLSKNKFTSDGYTFVGWKAYYKDANGKLVELKDDKGNVVTFKDAAEFLNLYGANKEEVTLVAQWKANLLAVNPKTGMFITGVAVLLILISSFVLINYFKRKNLTNNVI